MSENGAAAGLLDRMSAATRAENRAAGERLVAVGEFDLLRLREHGEHETWGTDTYDATCAEVAAALVVSRGWAESYLEHARTLRSRLPQVGALLCAGDISYAMFRTIVYRTELITDDAVMAAVDAALAVKVARWPGLTRRRLAGCVDRVVARADCDAVRRRRERQTGREFGVWDGPGGVSEVFGRLLTTDARVVDARLDALAATVCDADPRSRAERRADGLGALAAGAQRLQCRCGCGECPAAAAVASAVVVHVVAEQQTLDGAGSNPGSLLGADALIPPELVAELAESARRQPLRSPADAPAERGYVPSRALADFVRCRDLTCRFPGCDAPATRCDVDHTIPHADGGATHASKVIFR